MKQDVAMNDDEGQVNLGLDSLGQPEPIITEIPRAEAGTGQEPETKPPVVIKFKYKRKVILIACGLVLFIGWLIYSSTLQKASNDDALFVDNYRCSRYHYEQSVALNPNPTAQQISAERRALEYRLSVLQQLKQEIDNAKAKKNSVQWEIDQYNENIVEYKARFPVYEKDVADFQLRLDRYNDQVDKHNAYLEANCTK